MPVTPRAAATDNERMDPGNLRVDPDIGLGSSLMKRILAPVAVGVSAARHLVWYLNYQMTGEGRTS
jgi:hypothetical protein